MGTNHQERYQGRRPGYRTVKVIFRFENFIMILALSALFELSGPMAEAKRLDLPLYELVEEYAHEAPSENPVLIPTGAQVEHLDLSELKNYRVYFKNGTLRDASGQLISTPEDGPTIFVMDENRNLYLRNKRNLNWFNHSSFLEKKALLEQRKTLVAAAGEVKVKNGVVTFLSNKSGHYEPPPESLTEVVKTLKQHHADVSGVNFELWGIPRKKEEANRALKRLTRKLKQKRSDQDCSMLLPLVVPTN